MLRDFCFRFRGVYLLTAWDSKESEVGARRITPCSHSAPRRAGRLRCSAARSSRKTFRFAPFIRSPGRARILAYKKRARRVGTRANCSLRSQLRLHKYVMRNSPPENGLHIFTSRTIVRPFALTDVQAASAWFSDPVVMEFTPTGPDRGLPATESRLQHYLEEQSKRGFSKWIVVLKASGQPIGDAGILWSDDLQDFELGYRLRKEYWGQGLATEVASAWIRRATELAIPGLLAFTHIGNSASVRVLEKVGFSRLRRASVMNMDSFVFQWQGAQGTAGNCA